MQPFSIWTIVQLVVLVAIWVIIFCVGYMVAVWLAKRRMKGKIRK